MKTRLQLIAEYKLMGPATFIDNNISNMGHIRVKWDCNDMSEQAAVFETVLFEKIKEYHHLFKWDNNLPLNYAIALHRIEPTWIEKTRASPGVFVPYWIAIIFDYLDTNGQDRYIWIS